MLGTMGLIAGIWAEKFDQLAAFQNFLIMPATFLSGVFYSVHSLPPFWQTVSHLNPFFYMIDGFRYGFFGQSDVDPLISCLAVAFFLLLLCRFGSSVTEKWLQAASLIVRVTLLFIHLSFNIKRQNHVAHTRIS